MSNIRIVTDSACDVPEDMAERLNIKVIPAYINFGLKSYPDDGVSITKAEFYERLPTADPLPKTSAPPPGVSEEVLRDALGAAEHVVAIHVAGTLSSIIESTRVAAKAIGAERFTVIDSGSVSMGAGWQVMAAAEAAASGADLQAIVEIVASTRARMQLYAAPITMEYLRRSGRVNAFIASFGDVLQIKPMISVREDEVTSVARVRTFKNVIKKLVELAHEQAPLERLGILHLNNPQGAEDLQQRLADLAPEGNMLSLMPTPAIGANFGPGGLGLATISKQD